MVFTMASSFFTGAFSEGDGVERGVLGGGDKNVSQSACPVQGR